MRMGRAHEHGGKLARQLQIVGETSFSADQPRIFDPSPLRFTKPLLYQTIHPPRAPRANVCTAITGRV
jgi:hypothetical protein